MQVSPAKIKSCRHQFQNGSESFPVPPPHDVDGDEVEYPLHPVSSSQNITTSKSHPVVKTNGASRDKERQG